MSSPELQLATLFTFDAAGRITGTREPGGSRGPLFTLIRSRSNVAFAVRSDVPSLLAEELLELSLSEPPADVRAPPVHANRYLQLLHESDGPAFVFPDELPPASEVVAVHDERELSRYFQGWSPGEIAAGRAPVLAILEAGHPVSVCFCARGSEHAAEAGVETSGVHRRRGFGAKVTTAWASAIRASGRTPLYSTSWDNHPSLGIARKLGLRAYASDWSLLDGLS